MNRAAQKTTLVLSALFCASLFLAPQRTDATIMFVSAATSTANTITVPAHQSGDLIVLFAYRYNNATPPTVGQPVAGFYKTIQGSSGITPISSVSAWAIATSTNEVSGTWTNAAGMMALVFRGVSGVGASTSSKATSGTTCAYPALTASSTVGTDYYVRLIARATSNASVTTGVPPGYSLIKQGATTSVPFQAAWMLSSPTSSASTRDTVTCGTVNSSYETQSFELIMTVPRKMRIFQGFRIRIINNSIQIFQS